MAYMGKTNWQLNEIVKPEDMNRIEQGVIDAHENLLTHKTDTNSHTDIRNKFNEFVKGVTGSNATLTITKGNGTTSLVTVNNVANATNATNATQDSAGQQINSTYIKGLSISGKTITYTKGNNATGTITTQDTVYTHPNSGVTAGTYRSVTVDAQGHVTGGSNPTTLAGYGITDAPTKIGEGASGTWRINISGDAKALNTFAYRPSDANIQKGNSLVRYFLATSSMKSNKPMKDAAILHLAWDNDSGFDSQLAITNDEGDIQTRSQSDGTWGKWKTFLNEKNYNTYVPKKDGTGASGTWGINISGNATKDSAGQQINTTYIKGVTSNNATLTITKGDGTTSTINLIPVGTVQMFAGNTIPAGWLLCDGSAVSRTDYAKLFSAIGTTYGAGDRSTTFALPNLVGRFVEGAATAGTYKEAGLPNIKGSITPSKTQFDHSHIQFLSEVNASTSGALYCKNTHNVIGIVDADIVFQDAPSSLDFDASRSNGAYGNSTTVQPPALTMLPIIKY